MLPYALQRRKCGKYLLNLKFYKDLTDKGLKKIEFINVDMILKINYTIKSQLQTRFIHNLLKCVQFLETLSISSTHIKICETSIYLLFLEESF